MKNITLFIIAFFCSSELVGYRYFLSYPLNMDTVEIAVDGTTLVPHGKYAGHNHLLRLNPFLRNEFSEVFISMDARDDILGNTNFQLSVIYPNQETRILFSKTLEFPLEEKFEKTFIFKNEIEVYPLWDVVEKIKHEEVYRYRGEILDKLREFYLFITSDAKDLPDNIVTWELKSDEHIATIAFIRDRILNRDNLFRNLHIEDLELIGTDSGLVLIFSKSHEPIVTFYSEDNPSEYIALYEFYFAKIDNEIYLLLNIHERDVWTK